MSSGKAPETRLFLWCKPQRKVPEVLLCRQLRRKGKGMELIKKPKQPNALPQPSVTFPENGAELSWEVA